MADRDITIVTPATSQDLLTLDELKLFLGIPVADTSEDAQLAMLISVYSETCAELCNRTFGKEEVIETWREMENGRLFLSHWPVKKADLANVVESGWTLFDTEYRLEEISGKLSRGDISVAQSINWSAPVTVSYKGGYDLPTEAPMPLKQACATLIREERIKSVQAQTAGVRQIRHKEQMVSFFDPNAVLAKQTASGGKTPAVQAVEALLKQYMRFEV